MGKPKATETKRKKTHKSADLSKCCGTCAFCDKRNKDDILCSLTGESVNEHDVCEKCDTSVSERCQRCGKEIKYFDKEKYYNAVNKFSFDSLSGSAGQNLHLCKKCSAEAWALFEDMLEAIKTGKKPEWSEDEEDEDEDVIKSE